MPLYVVFVNIILAILYLNKNLLLPYSRIYLAVMEENGAQRGAEPGWQTLSATFSFQSLHLYLCISHIIIPPPPSCIEIFLCLLKL